MRRTRVLILTFQKPETFKLSGTGSQILPRQSVNYPFYGCLKERGLEVSVRTVGRVDVSNRRGSVPHQWWSLYTDIFALLRPIAESDVVVTWGTFGAAVSTIASVTNRDNRKVAIFSYANSIGRHKGITGWMGQWLYEVGMRRAGRVIFMTHRQAREAVEYIGCAPDQVSHYPVGVDTRFFTPKVATDGAAIRQELREFQSIPYVVVAGDQLRSEELVMAALDSLGLGLVRLTRNADTQAIWRKWSDSAHAPFPAVCIANLSSQEVRYAYQHALCMLNLVDNSWQPAGWTVLTEAMACGLPVVMNAGLVTEEMSRQIPAKAKSPLIVIERMDPTLARPYLVSFRDHREKVRKVGCLARHFVEKHFDIEQTSNIAFSIIDSMVAR